MTDKITLDESNEYFPAIKEDWFSRANECTPDTLPAFIEELITKYSHDYGTICHAITAAALAAAHAVDRSPQGGITGFQAGAIMWGFIREWNYGSNKTGLRIIDNDNFLYPQYAEKFDKIMDPRTFEFLQAEAKLKIEEADRDHAKFLNDLEQYKTDLAAFVEKYPDYHDRPEHYNHLAGGTGDEWEEYERKKDSGFEFAPREPYDMVNSDSPVYKHWQTIVDGIVPFGYMLKSDD